MTRAVILTGERGSGKTTLCLALAAMAPWYAGLVSPRILDAEGEQVGFSARDLATGEEWVLGRSDAELDGPRYGRYSFSSSGIARAVECLRRTLSSASRGEGGESVATSGGGGRVGGGGRSGDAPRLRVVVIDEIGPLEFECGAGLAPVLPLLAAADHLLLVVRPPLVARAEALVPRHERALVTVTPENRSSRASLIDGLFR